MCNKSIQDVEARNVEAALHAPGRDGHGLRVNARDAVDRERLANGPRWKNAQLAYVEVYAERLASVYDVATGAVYLAALEWARSLDRMPRTPVDLRRRVSLRKAGCSECR